MSGFFLFTGALHVGQDSFCAMQPSIQTLQMTTLRGLESNTFRLKLEEKR
jgi:hypothetical protein